MKTKVLSGIVLTVMLSCPLLVFSVESTELNKTIQEKKQDKQTILYIVDGKAMSAKEADKIDPGDIEKMEFIKEEEKKRKYTDEEVDIVVLITLKKSEENDTISVDVKERE